ncbi:MAG TPA: PASTA domain-containing protein [Thermoanaerobaculia bacterium]|nr:PASTA domain-containing protein [Thermoanaerobaculia bacterium]
MRARGCLNNAIFIGLLAFCFGASAFFWFTFFVRGKSVPMPALIGRSMAEARAIASDSGLLLEVDSARERHSDRVPREAIVWQNHSPGTLVKRGARILVAPSLGPLILRVPPLDGQSARAAQLQFGQLNLSPGYIAHLPRPGQEGVVAADPPEGTVVAGQTSVSLLAGIEPPPPRWVMPDLIERELDATRAFLERRGLRIAQVRYEPYPGLPDGRIIRQYPLAGAPVSSRDAISLVVSRQQQEGFEQP